MLRSFSGQGASRGQVALRVVLGVLLAANLAAAGMLLFPPGGSAEDLERELSNLELQATAQRALLEKTRQHVAAVEMGRAEGDQFLSSYFLPSRSRAEMLIAQLGNAARESRIKEKERSVSMDPIDGSDTLSMMSITANYEGTYADLLHFLHQIDKASSLMIIESLNAAPQTGTNILSVAMKLDTFVRDDARLP